MLPRPTSRAAFSNIFEECAMDGVMYGDGPVTLCMAQEGNQGAVGNRMLSAGHRNLMILRGNKHQSQSIRELHCTCLGAHTRMIT